jgi:sugar transferase EpsL
MSNTFYRNFGKRFFETLLVIASSVVLIPVMALVAIAIRIALGPGIFYREERIGRNGKSFSLVKFRSMLNAVDAHGHPLPDEKRLTPFGRLLRSSSLDELPELWYVLTGELSLIGPRPQPVKYMSRFTPDQLRRHEVRPGLTGWAQVNGRNSISYEDRFRLDVWYVDNLSFMLDLRIIVRTVWIILLRADISEPGHATKPEFVGAHGQKLNGTAGSMNGAASGSGRLAHAPALQVAQEAWSDSAAYTEHNHRELVAIGDDESNPDLLVAGSIVASAHKTHNGHAASMHANGHQAIPNAHEATAARKPR